MFTLDARLQADTTFIGRLPLCQVLLMNDSRYPWLILVPTRNDVREYFNLSEEDRTQLMKESSWVAEKMADHFAAKSMNVAALGNVVEQLHVHHIARFGDDPAWPGPVWGHSPAQPYRSEQLEERVHDLKTLLNPKFVEGLDQQQLDGAELIENSIYW